MIEEPQGSGHMTHSIEPGGQRMATRQQAVPQAERDVPKVNPQSRMSEYRALVGAERTVDDLHKRLDASTDSKMRTLSKLDKGSEGKNDAAYNRVANRDDKGHDMLSRMQSRIVDQQLIKSGRIPDPYIKRRTK